MQIRGKDGLFKRNGVLVPCSFCGKEIYRAEWRFKRSKNLFCSKSCNAQFRKKELASRWQGGKSFEEYGAEFDNSLKEQIRFRDKYQCQMCGCSQLENGRQLDCHHIDYDKKNNSVDNLIALCHKCHCKTTQGDRNKWQLFFKKELQIHEK